MRNFFPTYDLLFLNEYNTLSFIVSNPDIRRYFHTLHHNAATYLSTLRNTIDKIRRRRPPRDLDFIFNSCINDIEINYRRGSAYIGAEIKVKNCNYEKLTYYFALCDDKEIIRKFHFDYVPENTATRTPHPIFHLQYPGKIPPHLQELKHNHLECGLSEPRITFTPMSLALIINIIFKEFCNENTYRVMEDPAWRGLIRRDENFLLAPFFERCNQLLSHIPANKTFTFDICYGS